MSTLSAVLLIASIAQSDTTITIATSRRDLTGDGKQEILRLVGVGRSIDSLSLTFSIESSGVVIYKRTLRPLTRRVGFDGDRRVRSSKEQRAFIAELGREFFADVKFSPPPVFMARWRRQAPGRADEILQVIARDGGFASDSLRAAAIWNEVQRAGLTIFEFSSGGDAIVAIAWSAADGRFYRLIECC